MTHQRILIVDDDVDFRESLVEVLVRKGFQVDSSPSSADAQRKVLDQDFQVALIDVVMPGQDGVTCLDLILKARPNTRVVIMTGFSVPERLERAMELGAASVIHKPVDIPLLIESVNRFCEAPMALVAESDAGALRTLKSGLERRTFNVVTAASVDQLLGHLRSSDVALVVLDCALVGDEFPEVLRNLKGKAQPVLLVAFNAQSDQQTLLTSLDANQRAHTLLVSGSLERERLLSEIYAFWESHSVPHGP